VGLNGGFKVSCSSWTFLVALLSRTHALHEVHEVVGAGADDTKLGEVILVEPWFACFRPLSKVRILRFSRALNCYIVEWDLLKFKKSVTQS
jgi:hypothetical protein